MNSLFKGRIEVEERPEPEKGSTVYVVNKHTNTFGFVINGKVRALSPELTLHDRRELASNGMNNETINANAKRIYAAGGRIRDIKNGCKISIDYAKRLHAAFGRAKKKI